MGEQEHQHNIPSGNDSSTKLGAAANNNSNTTSKETDIETDIETDNSDNDKEGKPKLEPLPNPSSDPIIKCLKVSPNLFTPEKLNLFDTVALYTTLINCSQHIEQGERLNNLSWRIINKAMLKNKSINTSKKRDGVKNLYYVLNPVNKSLIPRKPNTTSTNTTPTPASTDKATSIPPTQPPHQDHQTALQASATTTNVPAGARKSALKPTYKSSNVLFPMVSQRFQQQHSKYNNNNNNNNDNLMNNNNNNMHNNENNDGQQHPIVVTGFDTNTLITKTRVKSKSKSRSRSRSSTRSSTRSLSSDNGKARNNNSNNNNKINSNNPSTDSSSTDLKSKYSKYNNKSNTNSNLNLQQQNKDSLFTSASSKYNNDSNAQNNSTTTTSNHNTNRIFFSSEDEEEEDSEWNSLSSEDDYDYDDYTDDDDDEEGDEEDRTRENRRNRRSLRENFSNEDDEEDDDDQYYKRQWNKLVFTKQSKLKATISPPDSMPSSVEKSNDRLTPSNSHEQIIRKSLLSGLFSNEKHNNNSGSSNSTPSPSVKSSTHHISTSSETTSSTTSINGKISNYQHHHHVLPSTGNMTHLNKDIITTTTTVTAHGSVTPAQGPMNVIVPLEEMIQRERRGRQMSRPLTATNSRKMSRRNSYNSLFSDEDEIETEHNKSTEETTRGRRNEKDKSAGELRDSPHDKQSNAPLTAQTILPTALSTHMFLPNSIVQQRRASRNGGGLPEASRPTAMQRQQAHPAMARRESIDIPTKNRSQLFLKTRMEISEEEKYARRKHLGNAN